MGARFQKAKEAVFDKKLGRVSTIVAILVAIPAIASMITVSYRHFAKTSEVCIMQEALAMKADKKEVELGKVEFMIFQMQVQSQQTQERIWKIEDRYPQGTVMPPTIRDQYRRLQYQFNGQEKQLDVLRKRKMELSK
jgi:hypothetical protein